MNDRASATTDSGHRRARDLPGTRRLWIGCVLPVLAWALHLAGSYGLAASACDGGPAPLALRGWLLGLTIVTALAALAGLAMSWSSQRRLRCAPQATRRRFMTRCGMLLGGGFAVVVLVQGLPPLVLAPCA